ncbi:Spx/MgsR family RNA polymerase-binding regulatory protein [Macrococcus brunensis]|uniref:Spx/MgsR family RNA polymerase-binding regulatory protein n=1 Tax=Macrococcus brunensis TaxID=198483 RepID=A0A4R6BGD2_9STAP|nr:Spx/MgsR family RNA polymerase-binding regulatory protein [Macrococcus brunensis]TDL98890.1 Spx/MgsR family RNA polymerase-binding regulatory protein [Macrococcus brunensis]
MLKFYQLPNCSTCRKAAQFLQEHGVSFEPVNIVELTPTAAEFKKLVDDTGVDVDQLFNRQGAKFRELELKEKLETLSLEEKLNLLASDGMLVKRPLATNGKQITLGFKEEQYRQIWL